MLSELESESIEIIREVVATAANPVMMYSIGKDSSVMLRLAEKAFHPAPLPFPLLHIDTTWKFREMIEFRDRIAVERGFKLLVHTNQEALAEGINPFDHGSERHTDLMKTVALRQALDKHGFDFALGGARRDEEKSRAKERVFSFRAKGHRWDPKAQRPDLWNLYNTRIQPGESIRLPDGMTCSVDSTRRRNAEARDPWPLRAAGLRASTSSPSHDQTVTVKVVIRSALGEDAVPDEGGRRHGWSRDQGNRQSG